MFKMIAVAGALAISVVWLGSCEGSSQDYGTTFQAVLGNDFTGNYAKIHGVRSVMVDAKYPCLNEFEACVSLTADGKTAAIEDLCPSDDTPGGTWNFTYKLYADKDCKDLLGNLGCVPTLREWLHPGRNCNDVVCITRNASKEFDFCVMDPVTGAGSEACPPCIPNGQNNEGCNPSP